ncbi:MAG TPA: hypothetical protein VFK13_08160 [Gemmatimonadaceae bacterium]|nr:hypothetical protein [Gemmatimonadaceae bacterium]
MQRRLERLRRGGVGAEQDHVAGVGARAPAHQEELARRLRQPLEQRDGDRDAWNLALAIRALRIGALRERTAHQERRDERDESVRHGSVPRSDDEHGQQVVA